MKKSIFILLACLSFIACKKKKEEAKQDSYAFEIKGSSFVVTYTNEDGTESTSTSAGDFKKDYNSAVDIDVNIISKTPITFNVIHYYANGGTGFPFSRTYTSDVNLSYSFSSGRFNDGTSTGGGNNSGSSPSYGCGYYNGKSLYLGSKGGCYYVTSGGNKSYVDRSYCKCN